MVLWPTLAGFGFVVLAVVVIALGRESTKRYEYERNSVERIRDSRPAAAMAGAGTRSGGADGGSGRRPLVQGTGMSAHPAGSRMPESARTTAWWLVDAVGNEPGAPVVAGPFVDRLDAEWMALSAGLADSIRPVYGVQRADGTVLRRQSSHERAWLAELGGHLARLPEEWDELLSDTDPLTTLVVEVGAALVEAGLPLHDCTERVADGGSSAGGVCLSPVPGSSGILVSWRSHDRMSVHQVRGVAAEAAVHDAMNLAVAHVLAQLGFEVESVPSGGCFRVTFGTADPH